VPLDLMPAFNPFDKYDKSKSASKPDAVDAEAGPATNAQPPSKFEKLRKRKNQGVLAAHRIGTRDDADGEQSDDEDGYSRLGLDFTRYRRRIVLNVANRARAVRAKVRNVLGTRLVL